MDETYTELAMVVIFLIMLPVALGVVIYMSIPTEQEIHERFEKVSQERIAKCHAKNGTPVLNQYMEFSSCILNKGTQ